MLIILTKVFLWCPNGHYTTLFYDIFLYLYNKICWEVKIQSAHILSDVEAVEFCGDFQSEYIGVQSNALTQQVLLICHIL